MVPFGLCIFVGAFLLFLVQPLMARFILPWFGGGPAVWTTCMLFFQVMLLVGYAYAHLNVRRLASRRQVLLHLALVAVALLLLPITPGDAWKPLDGAAPVLRILVLLTACLGLPYLVLAATGPLMQAWFCQAFPGVSPYRLYALSNLGSLLALGSYPFLIEPHLSRRAQATGFSLGLVVFAMLVAWCAGTVWSRPLGVPSNSDAAPPEAATENPPVQPAVTGAGVRSRWLWFALPACGSVLLLAVTNKLCQDLAVIPFLWIAPLGLYLLSFIISFDNPRWYGRGFWLPALGLGLGAVLWMTLGPHMSKPDLALLQPMYWLASKAGSLSLFKSMAIYLTALFVGCMVCHGELCRLRPAVTGLTGFYLSIAAGGALGGFFVAVVAPLWFRGWFELEVGLFAVAALAAAVLFIDRGSILYRGGRFLRQATAILTVLFFAIGFQRQAGAEFQRAREITRNFYGVLQVEETDTGDPATHRLTLVHGGTTHGLQYLAPEKRRLHTSYYSARSGIGRTMNHFTRTSSRRVGVVGLGTGTMATWGQAGDYFRFYEINSAVERLARSCFSYLADSAARIEVVPGDARLSLEREPPQQFDILVLDAFNSDSIPVHLLTREAFETYRRHLLPDGVIVVHISNRSLDLQPIVKRSAEHFGYQAVLINDREDADAYDEDAEEESTGYSSDWALVTRNEAFLKEPVIASAAKPLRDPSPQIQMWTDDQSDLFRILLLDEDGWLAWLRRWAG